MHSHVDEYMRQGIQFLRLIKIDCVPVEEAEPGVRPEVLRPPALRLLTQ